MCDLVEVLLGFGVSLAGGPGEELDGHARVLLHALSVLVHEPERVLRLHHPLGRRLANNTHVRRTQGGRAGGRGRGGGKSSELEGGTGERERERERERCWDTEAGSQAYQRSGLEDFQRGRAKGPLTVWLAFSTPHTNRRTRTPWKPSVGSP